MKSNTIKRAIEKYDGSSISHAGVLICSEANFDIYINDIFYISVMCLPDKLEEFAIGFLFFENIIEKFENIKKLEILDDRVNINLHKPFKKNSDKKILTTGCGKSLVNIDIDNPVKCKKIDLVFRIKKENIIKLMQDFNKYSELFLQTGGVHSCAVSDGEKILYFAEDIGRHNAFDKVVGYCLKNDIDINQKVMLTTGRISSEIMAKTIKSKIPIIISRSAPTDYAIKLAEKYMITLIGFARGQRFNMYAFGERVMF